MKRIVKISSLGLVALCASCANKVAPLKKVSPTDAVSIASVINNARQVERAKLGLIDEYAETKNDLFKNQEFPYLKKKMSADITITHDSEMTYQNSPRLDTKDSRTIKKHIFFDLDKMFYYCRTEMAYNTNDGVSYVYPKVEYYAFFVENEEQSEDVTSDYDKSGRGFKLFNFDNLIKFSSFDKVYVTKTDFITTTMTGHFEDKSPIISYETPFSLANAVSFGLTDVTMNWGVMNYYLNELTGDTFTVENTTRPLLLQTWIKDFNKNVVDKYLSTFKPYFDNVDDPKTYLNLTFRSADASSVALDTDFSINEDNEATETTGVTTQTSSVVFRDLYLSESHFDFKSDIQTKFMGSPIHTYTSTTFDQSINYNPGDNIGIPPDYLDYNPGV